MEEAFVILMGLGMVAVVAFVAGLQLFGTRSPFTLIPLVLSVLCLAVVGMFWLNLGRQGRGSMAILVACLGAALFAHYLRRA